MLNIVFLNFNVYILGDICLFSPGIIRVRHHGSTSTINQYVF